MQGDSSDWQSYRSDLKNKPDSCIIWGLGQQLPAKFNQTLDCALAYDSLLGRMGDLGKSYTFQPFFLWSFPKKEVMSPGHSGSFCLHNLENISKLSLWMQRWILK